MERVTEIAQSINICHDRGNVLFCLGYQMRIFLLISLLMMLGGCLKTKVEDTPENKQRLSWEVARIVIDANYFPMIDATSEGQIRMFADGLEKRFFKKINPELMPGIKSDYLNVYQEVFPKSDWVPIFADIYSKNFSVQELNDLLEFYRTPIGVRLLSVQPKISHEGMLAGIELGKRKQDEFGERLVTKVSQGVLKEYFASASDSTLYDMEVFTVLLEKDNPKDTYLQIQFGLDMQKNAVRALQDSLPKLKNNIVLLLSSKTATELKTKEGKLRLAAELRDGINHTLATGYGIKSAVNEVLFAKFIIQQ